MWTDSRLDDGYLTVKLPKKQSEVQLFFDCEGKESVKTESQIQLEKNEDDDFSKIYLPFIKLHLGKLDFKDRVLRYLGVLDNTLYVSRTGILEGSTTSSLSEVEV